MRQRSPSRRGRLAPAVFALVALTLVVAPASASARWLGFPGEAGGVFRSAELVRGQWVYTNGIGQAQGADADNTRRTEYFRSVLVAPELDQGFMRRDLYLALTYDFFGSHRGAHNGDHQLPTDRARWPDGTADLAELRMRASKRFLYVRMRWDSMPRRDAQVATLGFASEGQDVATRPWPRNARLSSRWQSALTVWGDGGVLTGPDGAEVPVRVRPADHAVVARVPLARLPAGPWRLTGGSGLGDPAAPGRYWDVPAGDATATMPGSGGDDSPTNVWGLLFAGDRPWSFDELSQSQLLSGGDASPASATVDPSALRRGQTARAPAQTGDFSRMFSSSYFEADGIRREPGAVPAPAPPPGLGPAANPGFNVSFEHTGRLQWYGMRVPERYTASKEKWPLIVYLHGFTGRPDEAFRNPVGLVDEADRRGYLLATPLGRGDYFYEGPGDLDVLEVIRDVQRRYRVDPDRIYLMGHSMGGYGTNNVATRHPDLFAAVAPAQGTDAIDLAGNLRNVPWFGISSEQDLDAGATDARRLYSALSQRGYDARLLVYDTKIHEYSSIYDTLPDLFSFFASHRRRANPSVVIWTRPPASQDFPKLGLVYDGAYWLDGVKAVDPAKPAEVRVVSGRIPHATLQPERAERTSTEVDTKGPTGRSAGTLLKTVPAFAAPARKGNRLAVTATNTRELAVDLRRARVRVGGRGLRLFVNTAAPLKLELRRVNVGRARLIVDGRRVKRVRRRRGAKMRISVPAGRHTVVLRAGRR